MGPTGIGKTSLGVKLANHFATEILSADSRQFFKEMTIGTAVPTEFELASAKHHFIQDISIKQSFSVGDFEKKALNTLKNLFSQKDIVVLVGGSGLYVDALINGLDEFPEVDPQIRESLNKKLKHEGLEILQDQLKELDPIAYSTISIDNPHRVIRALQICLGSGHPYSSYLNKEKKQRFFKTISIGLIADREVIYDRINERVEIMVNDGLVQEAKALYPFRKLNALNTVGYKELFRFFDGEISLDIAISEIKKNTRRFAKRQLTWFSRDKSRYWFDYQTNFEEIVRFIEKEIKKPAE